MVSYYERPKEGRREREIDRTEQEERERQLSEAVLLKVAAVHGKVPTQFVRSGKSLGAVRPGTRVGLLPGVRAHVSLQVVGTRELPLADVALEGAHSGVLAAVSTKLV